LTGQNLPQTKIYIFLQTSLLATVTLKHSSPAQPKMMALTAKARTLMEIIIMVWILVVLKYTAYEKIHLQSDFQIAGKRTLNFQAADKKPRHAIPTKTPLQLFQIMC
jgi:hypothetical protein